MATLDILSLAEGKLALKQTATEVWDARIATWITAASGRFDQLVGPVVQRTVTDELRDGGRERIFLRFHPISSITTVVEYDGATPTTLTAETNSLKPANGYLVEDYDADPHASYLSNIVWRRSGGADARFASGRKNVAFTYVAGRFANTAAVDERHKRGVALMLQNFWRSVQDGTGQVSEYDVPADNFPRFAVPNSVRDLFDGEIQDPTPL